MAYHRTYPKYDEPSWMKSPSEGYKQTITTIEEEDDFSGLFDADGRKLYRFKSKIGFVK
jgi:hypothetical protein